MKSGGTPRILLIGQSYGRGHAATSDLFTDLAESIARHSYRVEVLTSSAAGQPSSTFQEQGVLIHRVSMRLAGRGPHPRLTLAFLWWQLLLWCLKTPRRFDQAILLDTPYFLTFGGLILRWRHGTRLIAWIMDRPLLQISRLQSHRSVKARLAALLNQIQSLLYAQCQRVVVLGVCMQRGLIADGIPAERIRVIRTWAESSLLDVNLTPTEARRRCGLPQSFTVMYSGYAGAWHDFQPILEAVQGLSSRPHLQFLFCGEGPGIDEVRRWTDLHPAARVIFRPLVPASQRLESLCCGDLHLVALKASMAGTCCPSKLNPLLGLGRPVIVVAPRSTQTALDVVTTGAGVCAETGGELIEAIERLAGSATFPRPFTEKARQAFRRSHCEEAAIAAWMVLLEDSQARSDGKLR